MACSLFCVCVKVIYKIKFLRKPFILQKMAKCEWMEEWLPKSLRNYDTPGWETLGDEQWAYYSMGNYVKYVSVYMAAVLGCDIPIIEAIVYTLQHKSTNVTTITPQKKMCKFFSKRMERWFSLNSSSGRVPFLAVNSEELIIGNYTLAFSTDYKNSVICRLKYKNRPKACYYFGIFAFNTAAASLHFCDEMRGISWIEDLYFKNISTQIESKLMMLVRIAFLDPVTEESRYVSDKCTLDQRLCAVQCKKIEVQCNASQRSQKHANSTYIIAALKRTLEYSIANPEPYDFDSKVRFCEFCNFPSETMPVCGKCKKVVYCNTSCQRGDWKRHKKECQ